MIKIDCTFFHSKNSKGKYSVYTLFNCYRDKLEVIYYHIEQGNETKKGWENIINYLIQNVDLSECKLIVSDMFPALKKQLEDTEELKHIKKQNCIWHRVQSLCDVIAINKAERNRMLSEIYIKFMKMKNKDISVFSEFYNYKLRKKTWYGKEVQRSVEKCVNHYINDNFSFLDVREELKKEYLKRHMITTCDVESYFSKMKFYLKKHTNYASMEVLISKIMMFMEKENRKISNKKNK